MTVQIVQKIEIQEGGTYLLLKEGASVARQFPSTDELMSRNEFLALLGVEVFQIGFLIKHFRELKGWSLRDLDQATGVPYSQISKYENGKAEPEPETIGKLTAALGDNFKSALILSSKLQQED